MILRGAGQWMTSAKIMIGVTHPSLALALALAPSNKAPLSYIAIFILFCPDGRTALCGAPDLNVHSIFV